MDPSTLVMKLILGGILGMVGQGARVVVGLKKLNDKANQQNQEFSDIFKTSTLVLSLMNGFMLRQSQGEIPTFVGGIQRRNCEICNIARQQISGSLLERYSGMFCGQLG